jgi:hypothetical protein
LLYLKDISWYASHEKTLDPKNSNPKDNTQILRSQKYHVQFPLQFLQGNS